MLIYLFVQKTKSTHKLLLSSHMDNLFWKKHGFGKMETLKETTQQWINESIRMSICVTLGKIQQTDTYIEAIWGDPQLAHFFPVPRQQDKASTWLLHIESPFIFYQINFQQNIALTIFRKQTPQLNQFSGQNVIGGDSPCASFHGHSFEALAVRHSPDTQAFCQNLQHFVYAFSVCFWPQWAHWRCTGFGGK